MIANDPLPDFPPLNTPIVHATDADVQTLGGLIAWWQHLPASARDEIRDVLVTSARAIIETMPGDAPD